MNHGSDKPSLTHAHVLELLRQMIIDAVEANASETPAPPGSLYIRPTMIGTLLNIGAAAAPSHQLRQRLRAYGFAPLLPGTWVSPDPPSADLGPALAEPLRRRREDPELHLRLGYLALQLQAHPAVESRNPVQLWQIYVVPDFHGTGIAAGLFAAALEYARRHSHDVIWLGVSEHNARAVAFYRKHGFGALGLHGVGTGHREHEDLVMSCQVSP